LPNNECLLVITYLLTNKANTKEGLDKQWPTRIT